MNAVECKSISKSYGRKLAVNNVSFTLPEFSITGLIGPNGAGKTTLFSLIAGFLKADSGNVSINCKTTEKPYIGILPQDSGFLSNLSVKEHFIFYGELMGLSKQEAEKEADRVIEMVDLSDAAGKEGNTLSHGMHKRMAIAQSFIGNPSLIMLDEPTAGLDPVNAESIRRLIISGKGKHTFIVSSHNLDEIAEICDRVLIINEGNLLENKEMDQFTNEHEIYSFKLNAIILEEQLSHIRSLPYVNEVVSSEDGFNLMLKVDKNDIGNLITEFTGKGIGFKEMKQGHHLKEEFLKVIQENS